MHKDLSSRQLLRTAMRKSRQSLTEQQQQKASQLLHHNLLSLEEFNAADNIALYLSADGEINPCNTIQYCWQHNKQVFLPVLDPDRHNQLIFVQYCPDTPMCLNKYDIAEPVYPFTKTICAKALDLVLLPLVAFDRQGNRMGMGGGYYDRSFAFKNSLADTSSQGREKPLLVGLAHTCQQVEQLQIETWDIPLAKIVTDSAIIHTSD